nr:HNH endonuclease [uncultured Acetatifactor sp.]
MKEYAKEFYKSAAWKRARQQVITRANGLCERCRARGIYKPGYIVHHKEYITPGNIGNADITLNLDNLEYVCEDCHNKEHKAAHTPKRYEFDENGNLLPPKENSKADHTPRPVNFGRGKRTEGVTSKKLCKVAHI